LVFVHVAGAVRHPGLYRLPSGSRIDDAVRAAGGVTEDGVLDALNLAAQVRDGDKVLVPSTRAQASTPGAAAAPGAPGAAQGGTINLNTATAAELDALPGIGPAIAGRIIAYRDQHGGFRTVKDLMKVPGIGPAKFEQLHALVTV
jgi:competence protein ComEA